MNDKITIDRPILETLITAAIAHQSYLIDAAIRSGDTDTAEFLTRMSREFGEVIGKAKEALS